MSDLARWLARADELGEQGKYFDAHEELETPWKSASGPEKLVLQGVIQLAAGLHRLREHRSNPSGAFYLFERGIEKLEESRLVEPSSLETLKASVAVVRASVRVPASFRFALRLNG